jgi:hypothetical protein
MTTSELIEALKKEDPEGTSEVYVNGEAIYFAERLPGYYDGWYPVLIQDHSKDPYYNITGIRYTKVGTKIRLQTMGMEDILCDNPKATVELDGSLGDYATRVLQEREAALREEYRNLNNSLNAAAGENAGRPGTNATDPGTQSEA